MALAALCPCCCAGDVIRVTLDPSGSLALCTCADGSVCFYDLQARTRRPVTSSLRDFSPDIPPSLLGLVHTRVCSSPSLCTAARAADATGVCTRWHLVYLDAYMHRGCADPAILMMPRGLLWVQAGKLVARGIGHGEMGTAALLLDGFTR